MNKCTHCGERLPVAGDAFCTFCHQPLDENETDGGLSASTPATTAVPSQLAVNHPVAKEPRFRVSAIFALVGGLLCTGLALRSVYLQTWLVWYELFVGLIGGYVCIVATLICLIRSRFGLNRAVVLAVIGLVISGYGIYFFHVQYSPDLFFNLSETEIQATEIIVLCNIERDSKPLKYVISEVLQNRTGINYQPGQTIPNFDEGMDQILSQPGWGDQIVFFANKDEQNRVGIFRHEQVFGGRISGFSQTRLKHLSDLSSFRAFLVNE